MKLLIILCSLAVWHHSYAAFFNSRPFDDLHYYRVERTPPNETEPKANFSQLDIRVGRIVAIWNHTSHDRLYVMKVDFGGNSSLKTVVEGLRNYVPISELKGKMKLFLYNLKPFYVNDTMNEALILCAADGRVLEPISPPANAIPGDVAYVKGYEYKPVPFITQKIFDEAMFDLHTDQVKRATYLGIPWDVGGKGCAMVKEADPATIR